MKFSEILIGLRKENKVSANDLALSLNFTKNAIYEWEHDRSQPNIETLKKLADYFNVSIDYLVGRTDDEYAVPTVPQTEDLSARERELLSEFRRLGPFEAEAILIQIKALAGEKAPAIKK